MPDLQSALKNAIETWEPTSTTTPVGQQLKEKLMSKKQPFDNSKQRHPRNI